MDIAEKLHRFESELPENVRLVAVSKFQPESVLREAYRAGQRIFGENRVQELVPKYEHLPKDIEWHFIGHLQTNKVKHIASFVQMIHSVDSFRILEEIDKQAARHNRIIDCLLQVRIAREETKSGLSEDEILSLLDTPALHDLKHVRICGLMGVATFTDDHAIIRREFRGLAGFFKRIEKAYFVDQPSFCELSMGMSDDYLIALEEGSTMLRIGSLIFGKRVYETKI